jgi:hypothetical protein
MPNAAAHALGAAIGVGLAHMAQEHATEKEPTGMPFVSAALAGCAGSIPDVLEPAIHPNHRQFFHSVVAGGLVLFGAKKLYDWEPETDFQKIVRYAALVSAGAYLMHLILDGCTPKSLPLVGRV